MSWSNDMGIAYASLLKAEKALESAITFNHNEGFRERMRRRIEAICIIKDEIAHEEVEE